MHYFPDVLIQIDHTDTNWLILTLEVTFKMTRGL